MTTKHQITHVYPNLLLNKKIAIVGASGNLSGSKFGQLIDQYDEVIRFNRSPTDGYEIDVGSKTTLRAVNNHVFNNNDISKEGYTNSPPNFVKNLRNSRILYVAPDLEPWYNRDRNSDKSNDLYLFDYSGTENLKNAFRYQEDKNFQVGTIVILSCIASGLRPDLFGFDLEPMPRTHYYEARPPNGSVCHNISKEQQLIIALNQQGFLKVNK